MSNEERARMLKIKLIDDEYWIVNHEPTIGPYDRKADATSDMEGVKRFYRTLAVEDTPEDEALEEMLK